MSQNEMDEFGDIDTNVATDVENIEEDDTTSDDEQITWEEIHKLRRDSESLKKANKKIAMLEKGQKKTVVGNESLDDARVRDIPTESKFYDKNPEAEQYKDKIETLVKSNKLSREDALFLASKEDREIDSNREVYAKSNLGWKASGWEGWDGVITNDKFDSLSVTAQNEYIEKMKAKHGRVKFK